MNKTFFTVLSVSPGGILPTPFYQNRHKNYTIIPVPQILIFSRWVGDLFSFYESRMDEVFVGEMVVLLQEKRELRLCQFLGTLGTTKFKIYSSALQIIFKLFIFIFKEDYSIYRRLVVKGIRSGLPLEKISEVLF